MMLCYPTMVVGRPLTQGLERKSPHVFTWLQIIIDDTLKNYINILYNVYFFINISINILYIYKIFIQNIYIKYFRYFLRYLS